jgi:hypothetical protein
MSSWLKDKKIRKIVEDIQGKYDLSYQQTVDIISSQFKFVRREIEGDDFEDIRLPYLGQFKVDFKRINKIYSKGINSLSEEERVKLLGIIKRKHEEHLKDKKFKNYYPYEKLTKDIENYEH